MTFSQDAVVGAGSFDRLVELGGVFLEQLSNSDCLSWCLGRCQKMACVGHHSLIRHVNLITIVINK